MSLLNAKTLTKALLCFFLPPSHMSKNFADITFPVLSVIKKKKRKYEQKLLHLVSIRSSFS